MLLLIKSGWLSVFTIPAGIMIFSISDNGIQDGVSAARAGRAVVNSKVISKRVARAFFIIQFPLICLL
jgi:hypothetical protein